MLDRVVHPFRAIKRWLGCVKVRCRGLKKNTVRCFTLFLLFALYDLRMVRGNPKRAAACVRRQTGRVPCAGQKRPKRAMEAAQLCEIACKVPSFVNQQSTTSIGSEFFSPSQVLLCHKRR